jgi:hypothetical protein
VFNKVSNPHPVQPDVISITGIIASIEQNMTGTTPVPADVEEDGLGVQLDFGLDLEPALYRVGN